jgi:hypothetical protein
MTRAWERHQAEHPDMASIVQKGLDKFEEYFQRAELVPANVLAMCKPHIHVEMSINDNGLFQL